MKAEVVISGEWILFKKKWHLRNTTLILKALFDRIEWDIYKGFFKKVTSTFR